MIRRLLTRILGLGQHGPYSGEVTVTTPAGELAPGARVTVQAGIYAGRTATVTEPAQAIRLDGETVTRLYRERSLAPAPTETP